MTSNPLLNITHKIAFDIIKPSHIAEAVEKVLAQARVKQEELISLKGERTFENTMMALEDIPQALSVLHAVLEHINSVNDSEEFRKEYEKVQESIDQFSSSLSRSKGLWEAVKQYSLSAEALNLEGNRKRFLEVTVRDFKKSGADLTEDKKGELNKIDVELSKLTLKFSQNLLDATKAFELIIEDQAKLSGLPQSAIDQARSAAAAKDTSGWRFTLQAPSYIAVMTYLDDAGIREKIYRAYNKRASEGEFNNSDIIIKILTLRQKKAELMGFKNFADFILQDRMAKNGASANQFLMDLKEKVYPRFLEENASLQKFRDEYEGVNSGKLKPWDLAYYAEKQRQKLYQIDQEELRPYFEYQNVLEGMFGIANRLYGIKVKKEADFPVWDSSVETYGIYDYDDSLLGTFYTDFFPREVKRGGAWMNCFISGNSSPKGFNPHHGFIAGSFTPPVSDKPSLLTHDEVQTTFHEFGHLLHQLLSKVEIKSLSGINVSWDFVELPSQIMENWCWEKEALDLYAAHYLTGAKIPQDLYEKMIKAKNFRSASQFLRQVSFAALDLDLHTNYKHETDGDILSYCRNFAQKYSAVELENDYAMIVGFSHLFSSPVAYACGYYSYHWAAVLEADAFTRFQNEGIFNQQTSSSFRKEILSAGNTFEANELFKNFMGRDPDSTALLKRDGIL